MLVPNRASTIPQRSTNYENQVASYARNLGHSCDENWKARSKMMKQYFSFQWHITDECDQRCKHCYIFSENNCKKLD